MKQRDVSHWVKNDLFQGVLLFVQTIEECTFQYSYESYKVPALNCHYLCYDVRMTARDIDSKVLMDGNFIPLSEEFELMLKEDIFVKRAISDNGTILLAKDKNAAYYDLSEGVLSSKIKNYPAIASFIIDKCEAQNSYLTTLLEIICENISTENYSQENSANIYSATRMFVTDLVNAGYTKEHIYSVVQNMFFDSQKPVECSIDTIVNFFNCFTFESNHYRVAFGINKKASLLFRSIDTLEIAKPTNKEKKLFNRYKNGDSLVILSIDAIDAYAAFELAVMHIDRILAVHRINQHASKLYVSSKALVTQKINDNDFDTGILIQAPLNLMKKKGNAPDLHALLGDLAFLNQIEPPTSFYRAVALHNGAIESIDVSNQLLNLWTIIEVLIGTKRDNEDRINTICNVLCSVLNRSYLYSNIAQLLRDIKSCTGDELIDGILDQVSSDDELDSVERFALILVKNVKPDLLSKITDQLNEYPLLMYRIRNFSEQILCSSKSIYEYLKRHERRIRWHIMRIYRNRNMIVHNGSYMPYRNMLVENLHFYVDELLDALVEYYHMGILNNASIYSNICNDEANYYQKLGVQLTKPKAKQTEIPITSDNAIDLIFNGYSGNIVFKAIDQVLKERKKEKEENSEKANN